MPPNRFSRHRFTLAYRDSGSAIWLSDRVPYTFRDWPDNRRHVVVEGDNLWTLAGRFYRSSSIERPSGLWWVIADFQPQPVFDPTRKLEVARTLHVPSFRTLFDEILNDNRRLEHL